MKNTKKLNMKFSPKYRKRTMDGQYCVATSLLKNFQNKVY